MNLDTKIKFLKGVGPKMGEKLSRLGLESVSDLIFYYPRTYRDFTHITKIGDIGRHSRGGGNPGNTILDPRVKPEDDGQEKITIRGTIVGISNKKTSRRRFTVTEAVVEDGTGSIKVVWFNQPFLLKMLPAGREVILHGKITYNFYNREVVMESPERTLYPKIEPIYGETEGLTSKYISKLVLSIKYLISDIEEYLPQELLCHSRGGGNPGNTILPFGSEARAPHRSGSNEDPRVKPEDDVKRSLAAGPINNSTTSLPAGKVEQYNNCDLLPIQEALLNIHFPKNSEMLEKARRRIAFDELFMISLRANLSKEEIKKDKAFEIKIDESELNSFVASLPFSLTNDQEKTIGQILGDMAGKTSPRPSPCKGEGARPMSRLLNGDVGSGKTVVAAIAALAAVKAGYSVAVMAPTSILASQHFETFCRLFEKSDVSVGLYTRERKEASQITKIQDTRNKQTTNSKPQKSKNHDSLFIIHNSDIIIGTQALIQEGVSLENLGLVIVDEQHRFGVAQRAALQQLGRYNNQDTITNKITNSKSQITKLTTDNCQLITEKMRPHFLSMTATPIPRTLHLALFGDLDISVIKEKPVGRKEIKTRFVEAHNRDKAYEFIRAHIKAGRQAFVVCPLIESKEQGERSGANSTPDTQLFTPNLLDEDRKSVKAEYEKLQKIFPEYTIGMLHGKLKSKEKDSVMADFLANKTQILVSTSVVEVGVDVPNATVMMIEDAERFGLAQIHQFRGRVGRSEHQSFCFLFSSGRGQKSLERLKALESTSDGFKLAEIDLEQRGPGAVFGTEQSGMLDLKMASFSDRELIEQASSAAKLIIEKDPELKNHPLLKEKISDYFQTKHLE